MMKMRMSVVIPNVMSVVMRLFRETPDTVQT